MNKAYAYALVLLCVAVLAAGQILFKAVSLRLNAGQFSHPQTIGMFLGAGGLYAASTVIWVLALRKLPLSSAYMFMSLGFVIVPIAAHFFFGEAIEWKHAIATLLVVTGILVAAL